MDDARNFVEMFEARQREAKLYAGSQLAPVHYRGGEYENVANCYIALDMARRLNANPLMVMQNLYAVENKRTHEVRFGWTTQFLIACFNESGRFSPIEYIEEGEPGQADASCVACARELASGQVLYGPKVSMAMAVQSGWTRNPLWENMPQLMLRYRAAAFFIRTTAPEIAMGFYTTDELKDMNAQPKADAPRGTRSAKRQAKQLPPAKSPETNEDIPEPETTSEAPQPWWKNEANILAETIDAHEQQEEEE